MGDWFSYYMEQDRNEAAADAGLERTPLANMEYRAKTGEILNEKPVATDAGRQVAVMQEMRTARHRSWWTRLARLLEERPQECDCDACVANWETYG